MLRSWLSPCFSLQFFLSSFTKAMVACQNRIKILRPAPGQIQSCIQGRPSDRQCVNIGQVRGPGSRHQRKAHSLVGPCFPHQSNDTPGWLVGKCERENRKSFLQSTRKRPIKSLKWQSYANVSYYWIIAELHRQGDGIGSLQSFIPAPIC